jgi:hypothetical protein
LTHPPSLTHERAVFLNFFEKTRDTINEKVRSVAELEVKELLGAGATAASFLAKVLKVSLC